MSLGLIAMFVDNGNELSKHGLRDQALRSLSNALSCRGLMHSHRMTIIQIIVEIRRAHPSAAQTFDNQIQRFIREQRI